LAVVGDSDGESLATAALGAVVGALVSSTIFLVGDSDGESLATMFGAVVRAAEGDADGDSLTTALGATDGASVSSTVVVVGDSDGDVVGTMVVTSLGKSLLTALGACDKVGDEVNDAVGDIVAAGDPVEIDGADVGSSSQ